MGILDLLGGSAAPTAAAPAPAPVPSPNPSYGDFMRNLIAAAAMNAKAHPTSLWNALSGSGTDAAKAGALAAAPSAWQEFLKGQAATQTAGLGTARDFASTGALAGVNIDPNNPMASLPALTQAYGGVLNGNPASGSPAPGEAAPAGNPIQAQRAMYLRMGKFMQMQGNASMAKEFFTLANSGVPEGTAVAPNGAVSDAINGNPLTTDVGSLLAGRAAMKSGAEANAQLPAELTKQTHQGNVEVGVHSANADIDARHAIVNGIDTATGKPVTTTQADLLGGGKDHFIASNPYFDSQQAELKDLRTRSESAEQGLNLGQQIINAANGVVTGKGANALQNVRKMAQMAGQLTGTKLDPTLDNDTSKFEQLKFASQQLVAVASHDLSPRVAMNIYNQIAAVKPGDQTSIRGLRDIIVHQLIPVFQRNKALFAGTADYYKHNPVTNDAASVVPDRFPLSNFGVRDIHSAQPGDYFIDPSTGNLRQRPK